MASVASSEERGSMTQDLTCQPPAQTEEALRNAVKFAECMARSAELFIEAVNQYRRVETEIADEEEIETAKQCLREFGRGLREDICEFRERAAAAVGGQPTDPAIAAIDGAQSDDPTQAELVCAEAYQVVGSLLADVGQFDSEAAQKVLDNLSEARMVHDDVLPWPSFRQ